jgi:hypothetical protein
MNTPKDSTGGCCPPPPCSEVCFRSAKTKAWGLYPGNLGDIDRLAFRGVVYKPDRKMSTREVCALPGPFEAECAHREALAFLERVDHITAYDKAAQINGVADHETVGLA